MRIIGSIWVCVNVNAMQEPVQQPTAFFFFYELSSIYGMPFMCSHHQMYCFLPTRFAALKWTVLLIVLGFSARRTSIIIDHPQCCRHRRRWCNTSFLSSYFLAGRRVSKGCNNNNIRFSISKQHPYALFGEAFALHSTRPGHMLFSV